MAKLFLATYDSFRETRMHLPRIHVNTRSSITQDHCSEIMATPCNESLPVYVMTNASTDPIGSPVKRWSTIINEKYEEGYLKIKKWYASCAIFVVICASINLSSLLRAIYVAKKYNHALESTVSFEFMRKSYPPT